jgi:hypothetical protein
LIDLELSSILALEENYILLFGCMRPTLCSGNVELVVIEPCEASGGLKGLLDAPALPRDRLDEHDRCSWRTIRWRSRGEVVDYFRWGRRSPPGIEAGGAG